MSKLFFCTANLIMGNAVKKSASAVVTLPNRQFSTKAEATFELKPFKLYKLDVGPPTKSTLSSKEALAIYEKLTLLRRMETLASTLYKEKRIRGFCHLYSGQEAIAVGMHQVMRKEDTVITSYRCHVWPCLMGHGPLGVLAELTGKTSGCSRSKGGSMHMYGTQFFGGNGIVGAQAPLGAGLALAHKYKDNGGVSFTLYGDGAANQGQVFEAFNMAKLWKLPCVFLCENNLYGMGTSAPRSSGSIDYYKRGDYIPGIWVDGMDVLASKEATLFAIKYCTSGKGPILVEMETYRYTGHSMSDPGTSYRTREEVQQVRKSRDPIITFKDKVVKSQIVTEEQLKEIDEKQKKITMEAAKKARTEPEVSVEELSYDIYVLNLHEKIRGTHPLDLLPHKSLAVRKN